MYEWAEFRHFRYLLSILEEQGLRPAAEILHTAQSNLSVQARQFQENANVRLFRKKKSGRIIPTEAGVAFTHLAQLLFETRDEIIDALIAIDRGTMQTLRLGSSSSTDPGLFRTLCETHRRLLPSCNIRPTHGDPPHLVEEIFTETLDAALVTLPLHHSNLEIATLRQDRLVACLPKAHPLADKAALSIHDLQEHLSIFFHPMRHPDAHLRLLHLLHEAGITIQEYSRASHPFEMQALVKDGHGFALIREGTALDSELTTRAIAGMDWTVDTALIYRKHHPPSTIPVLVKMVKLQLAKEKSDPKTNHALSVVKKTSGMRAPVRRPAASEGRPVQLDLLSG